MGDFNILIETYSAKFNFFLDFQTIISQTIITKMSKTQANESAFKQLFTEMFNQGGDFSKVGANLKKPIKCYVKESFPHFLVTDGYFFVPVYFTKEAVTEFKQKFSNVHIVDLQDKVIVLNNWTLEMKKVNSAEVFTSYSNLEVRLVVHSFKPNL